MFKWLQDHRTSFFRMIGYLTAGVILLTVFLYLTFPWQKLSRFVEVRTEQLTGSSIEVGKSEIRFPLKLIWTGVAISPWTDGNPIRVEVDRIRLEWAVRPLLQRRLELRWSIQVAGGEGHGQIVAQPTDQGIQYRFEGDAKELHLDRMIEFATSNVYGIEGAVRITGIRHDWIDGDFLKGSGSANLEITDSRIESLGLVFNRITGRLTMKAGMAQLEDVIAQGPDLELMGSGNILFRANFPDSLINFNSRVTIRKATGPLSILAGFFKTGSAGNSIELSLRGALKRPTLFLNGGPVMTLTVM